jgi:tRNA pseudouridine38-40 synthase
MRVKAIIAYDGNLFKGFQKQKSTKRTITSNIEDALRSLGIHNDIRGSGRTDVGVHATGQTIDFELPPFWTDLDKLKNALNQKLNAISIKHFSYVSDDFHSRFSAKRRQYRYLFKTVAPSVFEEKNISFYPAFNEEILKKSLKLFEGEHDFSYFMKTGSITHTNIRYIYKASYKKYKNYHIINFKANGFLRAQVRMMIEAAMQVAQNKISLDQLNQQINLEKHFCRRPAPPEGLYLAKIFY